MSNNFDRWIDELRDDVIQGEYGHKQGEYTVCPEVWRSLFDQGLSPAQAFRCALGTHAKTRMRDEAEPVTKWKRTKREDAVAVRAGQTFH